MDWYRVVITGEGLNAEFRDAVEALFYQTGQPREFAVFDTPETVKNTTYYLSPYAASVGHSLLRRFPGSPCSPPARGTVHLFVGHPQAGERLPG